MICAIFGAIYGFRERQLAQASALKARFEKQIRGLVEHSKDGKVVLREGEILFSNEEADRLLGWQGIQQKERRLPFELRPVEEEFEADLSAEDKPLFVNVRLNEIDWDDRPALLATLSNSTKRREYEQLRETVEAMTRHDLKAPFIGTLSYLALLELGGNQDLSDIIPSIKAQAQQGLDIISNDLDLYQMERGTYTPLPIEVDLSALLRSLVGDLGPLGKSRKVDMHLSVPEPPGQPGCLVRGERSHIYRLFSNLLKNAIEASPPEATVNVRLEELKEALLVTIHNRGAIPASIRESFFRKFSTSGKRGGSGLGAYTSRLVARAHGGDVTFSTSESEGTCLVVTLPACLEKDEATSL